MYVCLYVLCVNEKKKINSNPFSVRRFMENIVKPRIYIVLMLEERIEEQSTGVEYYNGITTEMKTKRDNKATRHNLTLHYDTIHTMYVCPNEIIERTGIFPFLKSDVECSRIN